MGCFLFRKSGKFLSEPSYWVAPEELDELVIAAPATSVISLYDDGKMQSSHVNLRYVAGDVVALPCYPDKPC